MAEIKDEYPLQCHDTVFQQTSASLGHEGTFEDAFSIAKGLSDPNMHASFLQVLTKIKGFLKSRRPTVEQIWERYKKKYHKEKLSDAEVNAEGSEIVMQMLAELTADEGAGCE